MSVAIELEAKFTQESVRKIKSDWDGIRNHFTNNMSALQAEFAAINDEITEYTSFSYLAREQVNKAISNLGGVAGQSWDGFKTSTGKQLEKAFGETWDAFTDNIGELDNGKLEKAWDQFGDSLVEGVHSSWHGMLENMGNALTGQVKELGKETFVDPVVDAFKTSFFDPLATDLKSTVKGLFSDLMPDISEWLGWKKSGDGKSLVTGAVSDSTGGIVGGAKTVAGWLGLDSLFGGASVLDSAALQAAEAALGSNAAIESAFFGVETASTLSESVANSAALFDFGSQPSLGSGLGAGLATPLGAFGLALAPGLVGMMFHDEISGLLGMQTGPMTPEEAISNWHGQENFLTGLSGNISGAGQEWAELAGTQFGLFGQAAQEAAEDLERLMTVAGYTQEQLDQVVASLDPLSQELVTSGQAANTLEDEVRQLAVEIHAAANSMALTDQATIQFNQRIDDLAGRLGLSGDAAQEFKSALYGLADGFSAGGEEAAGFEAALDAFTQGTLASLTSGAEGSREAIQGLISSMKGMSGAAGVGVEDLGDGTTRFTAIDYASGGGVDNLGLYHAGSGGNAAYGYYHSGGLVAGWPKAHAGALISSLARDEVPIVARRGEYVVRSEAVNAATLPALKALNQGGGVAGGDMRVNFTINLNGNLMGNDDQIEDMVRLIESRLRQLKSSRWGA